MSEPSGATGLKTERLVRLSVAITEDRVRGRKGWELLLANLLCAPIMAMAWMILGPGSAILFLGTLVYLGRQILWHRRGEEIKRCGIREITQRRQ